MAGNNNINNLLNLRPTLFSPSIIRNESYGNSIFETQVPREVSLTSINETGSFRYDPYGTGLKSTQQLEVDYSKFENHTFFMSAQVKLNAVFEKILNLFPFDGNQQEVERFFDGLTGFEKYVYDQFPKYKGYLFLSGADYVVTKDLPGSTFPGIVRNPNGKSILNPVSNSMTFETWLFLPPETNSGSIVFQKLNTINFHGFSMRVEPTSSTTETNIGFTINSGSVYTMDISSSILKNQWNHIAVTWDRNPSQLRTNLYVNQQLVTQSYQLDIGYLDFNSSNFYVGSGSLFPSSSAGNFVPDSVLSGAIDELRIWHLVRNAEQRTEFSVKNVYAQNDLVLYYKFNEPSGSQSTIVIDSSGKSLHGELISGSSIRNVPTSSIAGESPVIYELESESPAILPDYPPIETLRQEFLVSASLYDTQNPSLILKLVPNHYFLEGQIFDSLESEQGNIESDLDNQLLPGSTKLGSTQVLLMMLYTWATFFDELKLYTSSFGDNIHVDYENKDTVPSQFLEVLARKYGITLPPLFVGTSIDQYINAQNIDNIFSKNSVSLQYIQNQIWRRILINIRDIISSKGTVHSVKSFIRAIGIDPDNNFRIREFGGPTRRSLKVSRESRTEASTMLSFISGGLIRSLNLSGSRVEPGFPTPVGSFVTNSSGSIIDTTNSSDGFFTSGSWTYEGIYFLTSSGGSTQSVVRMNVSGVYQELPIINLVAKQDQGVTLYLRSNQTANVPEPFYLSMSLGTFDPMDGNLWNFSFGKTRGDELNVTSLSSSFFLRAAKQIYGEIKEEYTTSSFFNDNALTIGYNTFTNYVPDNSNVSGTYLVIGSQSINTSKGLYLDNTLVVPDEARNTLFNGKVSQIRFWTKDLEIEEWREHVRNFKSIGVIEPELHFNFITNQTGSFERLRIDASTDQQELSSSISGEIQIFDFSQNNLHFSGTLFLPTSSVIVPQRYYYSLISPHFDESVTTNKIRIRSFLDFDNVLNNEEHYAETAPLYEIRPSETPTDNNRFTIDFSIVEALNQDIINIFATLDEFDNAIGDPALLFSPDYPTLDFLRTVYFKRLTDIINLKSFFEFYKWFDTNITTFIAQLLPRKTRFLGSNFLIESHCLERGKFEYLFVDQYLGDNLRTPSTILLQFLIGQFKKY